MWEIQTFLGEGVLLASRLPMEDTDKSFAFSSHAQLSEALGLGSVALQKTTTKESLKFWTDARVREELLTAVEPDSSPANDMKRGDEIWGGVKQWKVGAKQQRTGFDDFNDLEGGGVVAAGKLHDRLASCIE